VADSEVAIKVDGVSKTFYPQSSSKTIKQSFISLGRKLSGKKATTHQKGEYTALKDISFEVKKGDFFGIVGRNGCGKSTLLKILAGVYTPSKGTVQVIGKLTPFIELGVGFNPELSGRDNVFLNGSLLGFTRKQMEEMYDDIVDFAELHDFMETKLKNYSSGMQVRLAFSVAIRAESDILVIDEVLAVGDEAFQQKCLRVFEEYKESSRTVILVTHDMNSVRNLCNKAMLINEGNVKFIGDVNKAADLYSDINNKSDVNPIKEDKRPKKTKKIATMQAKSFNNKKIYKPSEKLELVLTMLKPISNNSYIGVTVLDRAGTYIFGSNTKGRLITGSKIKHTITLDLGPGSYNLISAIFDQEGRMVSLNEDIFSFKIISDGNTSVGGITRLKYEYDQVE
jgi:ABC-2 type transport system ATP-binding protein